LDGYQDYLRKESQRSIGGSVTATGHSRNQQLKAGDIVEVEGNIDAKGAYGLVKVIHRWEPQGYSNSFVCTPWKKYRNPQQPALRSWYGVVPARVVDHNDPKKMGRLKVQFFWQQDGSTHWARMVSPHAGPDRGFMFMPEVGDEVAIVFEDGDPERPVILGSVWNGVQQAPRLGFFGATSDIPDNNVKRIVTKAGNRVQMIDTPSKETVVLATPNSSALTMTEKHDSTGRTLVHIHSDGDIILTAPNGRVHVRSQFFSREIG
ncbi:phage baseplate assembly protein V, partial [Terriglobus sp. YAF25]